MSIELDGFRPFGKIPRLSRGCIITEKIDGSNAQIAITEDGKIFAGSRTRWVTPGKTSDNYGFAAWVEANREELLKLGPGRHFGEWWGLGINRNYGLPERRFSLFHTHGIAALPRCVSVVPVLYTGPFSTLAIENVVEELARNGSYAAPGFMRPEGVVIFHEAAEKLFKKTIENDASPKGVAISA